MPKRTGVFYMKDAFLKLRVELKGKTLSFEELLHKIVEMRNENIANITPDLEIRDILLIARRKHFVKELKSGRFRVTVA